ncbi:hypothetical protein [Streptomyces sp. HB2AG]|uniref:hypothetical protein n=1 Tax=Streptomyces sp. HB2AG TaxID=2983400 RepID=UPI0022AA2A9D|nr:hypothetical protein [Streptomyces sp. HB2AG]MCZ2526693.1 hypothetical protein [Streptomyces sp. HB2AG]
MTGNRTAPEDRTAPHAASAAGPATAPATGPAGEAPEPAVPDGGPARPRRRTRSVARWVSALLVLAVSAAATAYAVTVPERTELPGLETPHDGRWAYPALKLPALPSGSPAPHAEDNPAGRHHADLRDLLVPLPRKAVEDDTVPVRDGWVETEDYAALWTGGKEVRVRLVEEGLRHIAARAWSMPDGTRVQVFLLQFPTGPTATVYQQDLAPTVPAAAGGVVEDAYTVDEERRPEGVYILSRSEEGAKKGGPSLRYAYISSGDTLGVVMFTTEEGEVPDTAYRQTVALQAGMLG